MDSEVILNFLPVVANKYIYLNVVMHILIYIGLTTIFIQKFTQKRLVFNCMISYLFLTVAAISIINGNPFNFLTFVLLSVFAILEIFKGKNEIARPKMGIRTLLCFVFILIGIWYPHFVNVHPALLLLFSPFGIIPCPTLITVLGLLNLYYPKVNKGLYTAATLLALFYGITGVFVLKVYLDTPLLIITLYSTYNLRFLIKKTETIVENNTAGV